MSGQWHDGWLMEDVDLAQVHARVAKARPLMRAIIERMWCESMAWEGCRAHALAVFDGALPSSPGMPAKLMAESWLQKHRRQLYTDQSADIELALIALPGERVLISAFQGSGPMGPGRARDAVPQAFGAQEWGYAMGGLAAKPKGIDKAMWAQRGADWKLALGRSLDKDPREAGLLARLCSVDQLERWTPPQALLEEVWAMPRFSPENMALVWAKNRCANGFFDESGTWVGAFAAMAQRDACHVDPSLATPWLAASAKLGKLWEQVIGPTAAWWNVPLDQAAAEGARRLAALEERGRIARVAGPANKSKGARAGL